MTLHSNVPELDGKPACCRQCRRRVNWRGIKTTGQELSNRHGPESMWVTLLFKSICIHTPIHHVTQLIIYIYMHMSIRTCWLQLFRSTKLDAYLLCDWNRLALVQSSYQQYNVLYWNQTGTRHCQPKLALELGGTAGLVSVIGPNTYICSCHTYLCYFQSDFTECKSYRIHWQENSIDLDNGTSPDIWKSIIQTSGGRDCSH